MALCGYSEIVGEVVGLVQTTQRNVQCVTYFLLTESEGRTGRILLEVVQQRLRAIFSQKKFYIIWLCLTLYYLKSEPWRIGMNETVYRKAYKTHQFYSTQEIYIAPGVGGGGTPLHELYRYVRRQRVWFFEPFWSEIGYRF